MKKIYLPYSILRYSIVFLFSLMKICVWGKVEDSINLGQALALSESNMTMYKQGNYENLVNNELLSSEIIKKYLGEQSTEYRTSLCNLSLYLSETDSIENAIRNLEYVQQSISNDVIDHDYWQAYCASWLSYYYAIYCIVDLDNISSLWKINEKSDDCSKIALAYFEKHPEYEIEYAQALTHSSLRGPYDKAIKACKKALSLYKKNGIDENALEYIYTQSIYLQKLSGQKSRKPILFNYKNDYCRTEERRKENRMKNQPIILTGLDNITKIYNSKKLWEESIECHRAIFEAYKEIYGENEVCADLLCTLADKYSNFNNTKKAFECFYYAQRIYDNIGINNKYSYLEKRFEINEYNNIKKVSSNPLALYEELLYRNGQSYADFVFDQTESFCFTCRTTNESKSYGHRYLLCHTIKDYGLSTIVPAKDPVSEYAWIDLYSNTLDEAGDKIKKSIKKLEKNTGEYADKIFQLSRYCYYKGDYKNMLIHAEEACSQYKNVYGREDKTYIVSLQNLSLLYNLLIWKSLDSKKYSKANYYKEKLQDCVDEILSCSKILVNNNILNYTSAEREVFWGQFSDWFNEVLPYLSVIQGFEKFVMDGLSFSNNILFNCDQRIRQFAKSTKNETVKIAWKEYLDAKDALIHIQSSNITNSEQLNFYSNNCLRKEKGLLSAISADGGFRPVGINDDIASLNNVLDEESVVVFFINFRTLVQEQLYCAVVIDKYNTSPEIIPLFTESEFESKFLNLKIDYLTPRLYSLIWNPLEKYLANKSNVYIMPSGVLSTNGVEYFPDTEGVLPSLKWNIYRLSSIYQLLSRQNISYDGNIHASLYGGLKYDVEVEDMIKASSLYEVTNPYLIDRSVSADILRSILPQLEGTMIEVGAISETIKQIPESDVMIYSDTFGIEESVIKLSGKQNKIIHFATHGFYWTIEDINNQQSTHILPFLNTTRIENPLISQEDRLLTRSGLAFSGANSVLKGAEIPIGVEDGILTAAEASMLDLSGCDLLVLSACQTALGEVKKGEGVYGLQRGFKKAGVNSILMSLWKVDDRATCLLMIDFYKNFLNGDTKINSLRKAQKSLKEIPEYSDPKFWAGFILLDGMD